MRADMANHYPDLTLLLENIYPKPPKSIRVVWIGQIDQLGLTLSSRCQ